MNKSENLWFRWTVSTGEVIHATNRYTPVWTTQTFPELIPRQGDTLSMVVIQEKLTTDDKGDV